MNSERPDGLRESHCWSSTVDAIHSSIADSKKFGIASATGTHAHPLRSSLRRLKFPDFVFSLLFFFFSSPNRKFFSTQKKFDSTGILLHACGVVLAGENNLFFPIPRAAAKKPSCSCSFVCGIQIPCLYSFLHLLFLLHDSFLPIQE